MKDNGGSADRVRQIMKKVTDLYSLATDWIEFQQAVLGPTGIVRSILPDPKELAVFEQSIEYEQIGAMLAALRGDSGEPGGREEPTRILTIRLPESLHRALKGEAHLNQTSVNKWCITKLLQNLDLADAMRDPELRRPQGMSKK